MMKKPILCLDFDGVLHGYQSGWQGAHTIPDPPVPGAMGFIERACESFEVHVFSSRSNQPGGLAAMETWLRDHLIEEIGIERQKALRIILDTAKPPAMVTLDDRAITFTGEWPDIEELLRFQPWNKKVI